MDGPNAIDHRYLHEDCSCGSAFALSVAERLGMDMPVLRAFVEVAGALNDRDYIRDGRTLENLGFPKELSRQSERAVLRETGTRYRVPVSSLPMQSISIFCCLRAKIPIGRMTCYIVK